MAYEAEPDTNGIDNRADVVSGGSARSDKLNPTVRQEARRLAQMGLLGHGDERKKTRGEDEFIEALLAAAQRPHDVVAVRVPSSGILVAAPAALNLGAWDNSTAPSAEHNRELVHADD